MPSSFVKRVKITKLFYNINGQDHLGELSTKFSFFFPYFCSNMKMMSISLCLPLFCSLCLFPFYVWRKTTAPIMALEDHDGVLLQPFTFAFNAMAVCAGGGHNLSIWGAQFVNMIKNDGFEDGSLPLRSAGSQRSFENPTVPTYRSLTGLWFQSILVAPLQPSLNTPHPPR